MTSRQKTYFLVRGSAAVLFVISASVLPHGPIAAGACILAGIIGILTCIGVNAGGPGERAGAEQQGLRYEKTRAPQGDWPPYDPDRVVDGEVVPPPRPGRQSDRWTRS